MDFNSREELVSFLSEIERKYPVDTWQAYGVDLWPILKIQLFFSIFKQANAPLGKKEKYIRFINKVFKKVNALAGQYNVPKAAALMKNLKIEKSDIAFAAPATTRVNWKNKSFSRYFDPIMDDLQQVGVKAFHYDYLRINSDKSYKKERLLDVTSLYPYFQVKRRTAVQINISEHKELEACLGEINNKYQVAKNDVVKKLSNNLTDILIWKELWKYVFSMQQPKISLCICYYSNPMFGMCVAAAELGIRTLDMQHGGQGYLHPAYYFSKVKNGGYNTVPNYFWSWDATSFNSLQEWLPKDKTHRAILEGNPWIDYVANESLEGYVSDERKKILLTLQVGLIPLLPQFVIEAIRKTTDEYVWWLRLHPRMTSEEVKQIVALLKKERLFHKVEMKLATELPLPMLLNNSVAHLSSYSGSINEAAMMGVPLNIIIHEIGKTAYTDLIYNKLAVYFDPAINGNLFDYITNNEKQIAKGAKKETMKRDYKKIINELI